MNKDTFQIYSLYSEAAEPEFVKPIGDPTPEWLNFLDERIKDLEQQIKINKGKWSPAESNAAASMLSMYTDEFLTQHGCKLATQKPQYKITNEVFGFGKKPENEKIVLTGAPQQVQATTAPEGETPFNANAVLDDITAKYKKGARWLVIVPKGDKQDYYMVNNPKSPEFQSKIGIRPHVSLYVTNLIGNVAPVKS